MTWRRLAAPVLLVLLFGIARACSKRAACRTQQLDVVQRERLGGSRKGQIRQGRANVSKGDQGDRALLTGQPQADGANVLRPGPRILLPEAVRRCRATREMGAFGARRRQEIQLRLGLSVPVHAGVDPDRPGALRRCRAPLQTRRSRSKRKSSPASHVNTLVTLDRLAFVLAQPGEVPRSRTALSPRHRHPRAKDAGRESRPRRHDRSVRDRACER